MQSAEKVTSLAFLESFTGNDTARMRKYISLFLGSAPAEMELIRKSLSESNWDALRGAAHSLKPQMVYMGAKGGEDLLKTIEHNAAAGTVEPLPEMVAQFDKLFTSACEELNVYLRQTEHH